MNNLIRGAAFSLLALPAAAEGTYAGFGFANATGEEATASYTSFNGIGLIGYNMNEYVSFEAEASFVIKKGSVLGIDIGASHMGTFAKFSLPTSGNFTPHARLGYIKGEAKASAGNVSIAVDDTAVSYGIGAEYEFVGGSSFRADYSVSKLDGTDASILSFMTVVNF